MFRAIAVALLAAVSALPRALVRLESETEDLGEQAQRGHWRRAGALLSRAERDAGRLGGGSDPATLQALGSALAEAQTALRAHDRWSAAFAANRASGVVVRLYAPFHPVVPTDVMQLDVLLRESELDGLTGAPSHAAAAIEQSETIWQRLSAAPPLRGTATARHFEGQLKEVEQASRTGRADALAKSAGAALEGVDTLESMFEKAAANRR